MVRRTTYREKLKDPRWQRKRLEILSRDDWQCRFCMDRYSTLHVHHLNYHGEPWEAPGDQLVTLCELCHDEERDRPELLEALEAVLKNYPVILLESLVVSLDKARVGAIPLLTNYLRSTGGKDTLVLELLEKWNAETDEMMRSVK